MSNLDASGRMTGAEVGHIEMALSKGKVEWRVSEDAYEQILMKVRAV